MSIRHSVELIGRDRTGIANAGIAVASRIADRAMRFTVNARRYGHDPVNACNAVLLGDINTTHASATDVLAQVMVVSRLKGRRRSVINARPHVAKGATLARMTAERGERKLEDEERALLLLLLLTDEEARALRDEYSGIAQKLLEEATTPLVDRIEGANDREIRNAFVDAGFAPSNPYAIQNIFTTAGVRGYEDGRSDIWEEPIVRESLYGFRYSAILDDRTTELCRTLDGTIAPKDDPIWAKFTPPNHFFCRSVRVEVWRSSALNEPDPAQTDATPEQFQRFTVEKQRFLSYF